MDARKASSDLEVRTSKSSFAGLASTDSSGQAIVEFLLSIITFLFCVLVIIQIALAFNAYSLVRYAAYNAARAGVVHGGNLDRMREAARISLLPVFPRHGRADHVRGFTENYLGALATDQNPVFSNYLNFVNIDFPSVSLDAQPITEVRILDRHGLSAGTVVTFDDPEIGRQGTITVQVVHQYELVIPMVKQILFYLYTRARFGLPYKGGNADYLAAKMRKYTEIPIVGGFLKSMEYRIPLTAHYTMRLHSDYVVE